MIYQSKNKVKKKLLATLLLILVSLLVNVMYAQFKGLRQSYARVWYPAFSSVQRMVTGWCPFSLGDVLYLIAGVLILFYCIRLLKAIGAFRKDKWKIASLLLQGINILIGIYLIFLIFWALNYRNHRVEREFSISPAKYSTTDLVQLSQWLRTNVNQYHRLVTGSPMDSTVLQLGPDQVFKESRQCYQLTTADYPGLTYQFASIKPTMFGYLMNYLGVSGYYNPFTGEAQVNTTIPEILQPFVCCHEIAHQIGFAPEEAANFVGYVAAMHSHDPAYRYSANFDLMLYALGELRFRDSNAEKEIWTSLDTGVKKDYRTVLAFYHNFSNPINTLGLIMKNWE